MSHAPAHDDARLAEDGAARERALDVERSFLVQAPAGSGKTGLLIQRYLALLGRVERPERVLAITFTRKAAGEMRDRVVRALAAAEAGAGDSGMAPHEQVTLALARRAIAQDRRHGWNLVAHPSRLAIRTIDSLAQAIGLQAPIASGLPPNPRFTEDATPLHVEAVRSAIAAARPDDPRWRELLDHQDNDADALAGVLARMLAQRDQWFPLLREDPARLRERLEATLAREVQGELDLLAEALAAADLAPVARFAASAAAIVGDADPSLRDALVSCARRGGPPPIDVDHLDEWRAIAAWLLTKGSTLRRVSSGMPGIPAVGEGPGKPARSALAREVKAWLETLAASPGFEGALRTLAQLPPLRYADDEWARIASLLSLLPELAASLTTVFTETRRLDFPQGTLAALAALGTGEEPTDLLLRLDLAVDHMLIDEFQDTSFAHLDLIGRLVSGWSAGDGRTLFAVGDPMQSIYRFRGAEVRAFVEAQSSGAIEGVPVECLTLRRNFRSQEGLVAWVNATFPEVLGDTSDPWRGRVAFADAVAVDARLPLDPCTIDIAATPEAEARCVVARVREALGAGGNVAILVRARSHLVHILPALRAASISYAAVDLDVLAERPAVRDLVALAHAMVQPDDRLAWLAVLRAPWCGLTLADLHAIVRAADARADSIAAIADSPPSSLAPDGATRLARVAVAMQRARAMRPHATLAERVWDAWHELGGPATLDEPLDLVAVDDVIALIAEHESAGDLPDWPAFVNQVEDRKLSPQPGEDARVQVMTMHKAKGLEFDTVILPGLARGRSGGDTPLVRMRTRRHGLVVGLAKARGGEHDGVYAYLKALAEEEERAELARIAYVACTRARKRLSLVAAPETKEKDGVREWKRPTVASIFGLLGLPGLDDVAMPDPDPEDGSPAIASPAFERLPMAWRAPNSPAPLVHAAEPRIVEPAPPFDWARERARRLGVVVHRVLAQVAADGLARWDDARIAAHGSRIEAALVEEGALPADAPAEATDVRATIAAALRDSRGRWLFDPSHADAHSEWALSGVDDGDIVHVVLDRTFVADGVRWIVDFKTGTHEGADAGAFLDAEVERYRSQLERYARIVRELDPAHPVKLALYHPRVAGGWRVIAS